MCPRANAGSSPSAEGAAEPWVLAPDVRVGVSGRFEEIWRYRRILWFFAVKAVQRLFANTRFVPLVFTLRFIVPVFAGSLVYGTIMNVPSEGVPYFLFLLTGVTIWNCFDGPLTWATRGLEMNRQLLTKLYLPRIILPAAQMSAGLVDVAVCSVVIVGSVFYYRYTEGVWYSSLSPRLLLAPCAMLLAFMLAFSLSLWTSVWQARARDMRFVLLYVLGFWFLLTPIVYPASHLPAPVRWAAAINPMSGPVAAFKWAVLGVGYLPVLELAASATLTCILLVFGTWHFSRAEGDIADRL